jgi:hypothetical protein
MDRQVMSRGEAKYEVVAFLVDADDADEAEEKVYEDILWKWGSVERIQAHEFLTTEPADAGFWSVTVRFFEVTDGDPS